MGKSKARFGVTVAPEIYEWIAAKAESEGRTATNLATWLLTRAVKEEMEKEQSLKPLQ